MYNDYILVSFTVTVDDELRIISARKATKIEVNNYIAKGGIHYAG